jgi:hypothetical protein
LLIPANTIAQGWREDRGDDDDHRPRPRGGRRAPDPATSGHGRREDALRAGLPQRAR